MWRLTASGAFLTLFICSLVARAAVTQADYDRAWGLGQQLADKVVRDRVEPHWFSPTQFWYAANLGQGRTELLLVDAERGERRVAFDHAAVAKALGETLGRQLERNRLPIDRLATDGDAVLLRADERWFRWQDGKLEAVNRRRDRDLPAWRMSTRETDPPGGGSSAQSPDGQWHVERELGALVLVCHRDGSRKKLAPAPDGDGRFEDQVRWAPDSSRLVAWQVIPGQRRMVHLIESSPRHQLQPILHEQQYDKPGDRLEQRVPRLFVTADGSEVAIDMSQLPNPWSLDELRWKPDSSGFSLLYNARGHQTLKLVEIAAVSGAVRTIVEDTYPTFVHYSGDGKLLVHRLDTTGELVWASERDGYNHLYLVDMATGQVKQQITRGNWVVRGIDHIDADKRQIWFRAGGIHAEQDPYYVHHARVDFDGNNLTLLTQGDGTHDVAWSPDGRWLIDTWSRVDMAPVVELRRASDGGLVTELERGDVTPLAAAGWKAPERFVAKGRDGQTDIYGIICRPTNFDPAKKYPVVEEHYAGPQAAFCPKRFAVLHRSQEMAELGFIVVQMDGMGTDYRGKKFHDVCSHNLADGGFADRIAWMKAAAAHEPAIDLARVGIRGTSAGGQTAMAALWQHGDFYKAAVSNCGCHDNRTDKVWWNEQWMGWPVGPHYAAQSNVTNAHRIQGDLLLIVGEMDHNVPPTSTLQVVDALIKADKNFDFVLVPGADHGAGGRYATRKTWEFFVEKLGAE